MRQKIYLIIGITIAVTVFFTLALQNRVTSIIWLSGLAIGFVVQRSKFCFSAAVRDLILFRSTALAKAVLLLIVLSTIGFAVIQYVHTGMKPPGKIYPAGWHNFIGAILFGMGMVLAGGCVSSSVMRVGEWFSHYWVVVAGILVGSVGAAFSYPLWNWMIQISSPVYLPQVLGWFLALVVQGGLFLMIFLLLRTIERKRG